MKTPLILTAVATAALSLATTANAGTCPADQTRDGARTSGVTTPSKVTDTELAFVKLDDQIEGLDNRRLRLRRLVVKPGGVVPWHSHTDRPALIMTVRGSITEYRSSCAVPIVHNSGDVVEEVKGVSHYWRNTGNVDAILLAADIKNDAEPAKADH
jgi:quercetin dioxygenase-like cupin family protein